MDKLNNGDKTISIIIPCKNEENYIEQCLLSFVEMDYPNELLEILVVDGESSDNTKKIIQQIQKKYSFIKLLNNPKIITPHALNIGIRNAKSNFIMIASAHSSFSKSYITELIKAINELNANVVGGFMLTDVKNKNKKTISISKVLANKFGVGNSMFRVGAEHPRQVDTVPFGIYKKSLLIDIGLYNERLIRNHDIELSKRLINANKKIYLIPSAKCTYYARENFLGILKNSFQNGLWNILTVYITKQFNSLSIRHFIPLLFLLSLIVPLLLMSWTPIIGIISAISFILYSLMTIIMTAKISDKSTSFFYIIFTFWILHFSYGVGSLIGLLRIDYLLKKN